MYKQKQIDQIRKLIIEAGYYRKQTVLAKKLNINPNSLSHALSLYRTSVRHQQILDQVTAFLRKEKNKKKRKNSV